MKWRKKTSKVKDDSQQDKKGSHFEKLTPFVDADISKYEEMLDFALITEGNDDITNVAMTGLYGSGKSSVIETYKKRKKDDLRFLSISLSHYDGTNDIDTKELEGKIVNQLLHQINHKRIPKTIFKAKSNSSKLSIIGYTVGIVFLFGLIYGWFNKISAVKNFLLLNFQSKPLDNFLKNGWFDAAWLLVIGIISLILLYKLIKLQANEKLIKALTVSGNSVEILEESKESYFDKFMNDVIYLFANSGADVIVFEDLDRFNDSTIYEKLQEINILANKRMMLNMEFLHFPKMKRWILRKFSFIMHKNIPRKLVFLYLIRDDAFESKDRTKFFDFVIPIVPTMDGSNSYTKFIEIFERMEIYKFFNPSLLKKLSLYIDDYRLLKNVANEYFVYEGRINGTKNSLDLDKNKLLALVIYKNLFPRDFSELQYGKSYLNAILSQKNSLIRERKNKIELKLEEVVDMIQQAESEKLKSIDELDALYLKTPTDYNIVIDGKYEKDFNERSSFIAAIKNSNYDIIKRTTDHYYGRVNNTSYNIKAEFDSFKGDDTYSLRLRNIKNNGEEGHKALLLKKAEIEEQLNDVRSIGMNDLLFEQSDTFFENIINRSEKVPEYDVNKKKNVEVPKFLYLQKSDYFPLLKFLIREELIDEKYSDYMTYFYKGDLSRNDRNFIRSVYDFKPEEFSYHIDTPEKVLSDISETDFVRYGIKNLDLALWIMKNGSSHGSYYNLLIENLRKNEIWDFIYEFYEKAKSEDELLIFFDKLHNQWPEFVIRLLSESSQFGDEDKLQYLSDYLTNMNHDSITSLEDLNILTQYIGNSYLLSGDYLTKNELLELLPYFAKLGVNFLDISNENIDLELVREIVKLKIFKTTKDNIKSVIQAYGQNISNEDFSLRNYTAIKLLNNNEINEALFNVNNFGVYLKQYLDFGEELLSDSSKDAIEIVNSSHIKDDDKLSYANRLFLNPKLQSIVDVKDSNIWEIIVKNRNLVVTSENIISLLKENEWKLDMDLIEFINSSSDTSLLLDTHELDDDEINQVFNEFASDSNLKENLYISLLKSMDLVYQTAIPESIPNSRKKLLIKNSIIEFSNENLVSLRATYSEGLTDFALVNFDKYIEAISHEANVDHYNELIKFLQSNRFSSEQSKQIIDVTEDVISVNYPYSEEIKQYILEHAFNDDDLDYLIAEYFNFGKSLAFTAYNLFSKREYLAKIIDEKKVISNRLLDILLFDSNVDTDLRNQLLLNQITSISAAELVKYPSIPQEFLDVLHRKKIRVTSTEINFKFAEAYKKKNWVTKINEVDGNLVIQGRQIL
ncbi:hypothetical protein [Lactococcus lactis]|uniref:YobI family P-loop NTPase n=1 Tax=Lactococcus lactis TaxID=1358 RepID=UPI00204E8690|nr:hypothetical protein [Lactococcus lactis]BDH82174.1 hypothetical protein LLL8_18310 [Lactococcus lactis]